MADLSPEARKAMTYWNVIQESAAEGLTTADLWSAIQDEAEDLGLESPGVSVRGVNELRGLATSIIRSGRSAERLDDHATLDSLHIGEAPWSRPLAEQASLGILQVRYLHTVMGADGPSSSWRTSVFTGRIPATMGDLRAAIQEDANELSMKYGVSHVSTAGMQVFAV